MTPFPFLTPGLAISSATPRTATKPAPTTSLAASPADRKLRKAAGEFESMLLANLWKSMKTSFTDPSEDSDDPAHDTLEDWAMDAMAGAVGKAGGLGLGKLILKHLEPALLHSQNGNGAESGKASALSADIPL